VIEIDEAAFISKNSDKNREREPYRFHSRNFWPPQFLVKELLSEGLLLQVQTRRNASLHGQARSTSWKDVGQVGLATPSPPRGGLES